MSAPVLPSETSSPRLVDFAFGPRPPRSAAELPEPGNGVEMWWRAVALGGTGHYAAARTALRRLRASTTDPVLLSLAASTLGSLRRQLGRHELAAHDDGHAAALVLPRLAPGIDRPGPRRRPGPAEPTATPGTGAPGHGRDPEALVTAGAESGYYRAPDLLDAAADALIGLAADALGTGRLALAARLLDRCSDLLAGPTGGAARRPDALTGSDSGMTTAGRSARGTGQANDPHDSNADVVDRSRALVRLHWVRAETALAGGHGAEALVAAEAAYAWSERGPSVRHQVKSRLLVAAAAGVTGDTERAAELAALVDRQCREAGLVPLRWACAMLRTGLPATGAAPAAGHASATADAEACRALISRRGGRFRGSGR